MYFMEPNKIIFKKIFIGSLGIWVSQNKTNSKSYFNSAFAKGGPRFTIAHALRSRRVAVVLQAHITTRIKTV